jgi:hypothetical protein
MRYLVLVLALCGLSQAQTTKKWTLFNYGYQTYGTAVNSGGQVTGTYVTTSGVGYGFIRNPDGTLVKKIVPALALGINTAGEIVGDSVVGNAFLRMPNGAIKKWPGPGAGTMTANSVNDAGYLAGIQYGIDNNQHQCMYVNDTNGVMVWNECFTSDGAIVTVGSINNSNQVSGWWSGDGGEHGFVYDNGTLTQLDFPGAANTRALAMNDSEEVVGSWIDAQGATHGFIWSPKQGYQTYDVPKSTLTIFTAVNAAGAATGYYYDQNSACHGFTLANGKLTVLNVPKAAGTIPLAINLSGQVAGEYFLTNPNQMKGFLYTPITQ